MPRDLISLWQTIIESSYTRRALRRLHSSTLNPQLYQSTAVTFMAPNKHFSWCFLLVSSKQQQPLLLILAFLLSLDWSDSEPGNSHWSSGQHQRTSGDHSSSFSFGWCVAGWSWTLGCSEWIWHFASVSRARWRRGRVWYYWTVSSVGAVIKVR